MTETEAVAYRFEVEFPDDPGTWYTRLEQIHPEEWADYDVSYRNVTPLVEADHDDE